MQPDISGLLGWRNGRRRRLKISRPQGHVGSTPTPSIAAPRRGVSPAHNPRISLQTRIATCTILNVRVRILDEEGSASGEESRARGRTPTLTRMTSCPHSRDPHPPIVSPVSERMTPSGSPLSFLTASGSNVTRLVSVKEVLFTAGLRAALHWSSTRQADGRYPSTAIWPASSRSAASTPRQRHHSQREQQRRVQRDAAGDRAAI
jgi:hypothetical protein